MTDQEYQMTQALLLQYWKAIQGLDLQGFAERISQAEKAGPVTDPTLFRDGQKNLALIKDMAEKAAAFKAVDCMALIPDAIRHQARQIHTVDVGTIDNRDLNGLLKEAREKARKG